MVKLLDVRPDGYEMIIREGAAMTRYRNGLDKPAPLKAGEVAGLAFDFNSAAIVFDKGHQIGVYITSSSTPAYEIHPNTYEPVASYEKSAVARQTIHTGSRIILPVASKR